MGRFSGRPQCLAASDPTWEFWNSVVSLAGPPNSSRFLPRRMFHIMKESLNLLYIDCQTPVLCQHQSGPFLYTECNIPLCAGDVPVPKELGQKILALKSQLTRQLPGWVTEMKADGFPWL